MGSTIKLCPNCRKAIHASELTWYADCPFCGFRIGKFIDRRTNLRHRGLYKSAISTQGLTYNGYTLDISSRGAKLLYKGRALEKGRILHLTIREFNTEGKAVVVWSRQVSEGMVHIGLRIMKQNSV